MSLLNNVVGKIFKKDEVPKQQVSRHPDHPVFGEDGYQAPISPQGPGFVSTSADLPPNYESRQVDNTGIPTKLNHASMKVAADVPDSHNVAEANVHTEGSQHYEVRDVPQNHPSVPQMKHADVWEVKIETSLQVINSKLDAVKSMVENMERRVANIEQVALREQQQRPGKRW